MTKGRLLAHVKATHDMPRYMTRDVFFVTNIIHVKGRFLCFQIFNYSSDVWLVTKYFREEQHR